MAKFVSPICKYELLIFGIGVIIPADSRTNCSALLMTALKLQEGILSDSLAYRSLFGPAECPLDGCILGTTIRVVLNAQKICCGDLWRLSSSFVIGIVIVSVLEQHCKQVAATWC